MKKSTKPEREYKDPYMRVSAVVLERVFTVSNTLSDMEKNDVYDEDF